MPIDIVGYEPARNPFCPDLAIVDFSRVQPGNGLAIQGAVVKSTDGGYHPFASEELDEGMRRFVEAECAAARKLDIFEGEPKGTWIFFDRDRRSLSRKIAGMAARSMMPEDETRKAFRGMAVPLARTVADKMGVPIQAALIRLKQLGLLHLCVDVDGRTYQETSAG